MPTLTKHRRRPRSGSNIESNWVQLDPFEWDMDSSYPLDPDGLPVLDICRKDDAFSGDAHQVPLEHNSTPDVQPIRLNPTSKTGGRQASSGHAGEPRSHGALVWANKIASAIALAPASKGQDHNEVESRTSWQILTPLEDKSSHGDFDHATDAAHGAPAPKLMVDIPGPSESRDAPDTPEMESDSPSSTIRPMVSPTSTVSDSSIQETYREYMQLLPAMENTRHLYTISESDDGASIYRRTDDEQMSPPPSACSEASECTFYTAKGSCDSPLVMYPRLNFSAPTY